MCWLVSVHQPRIDLKWPKTPTCQVTLKVSNYKIICKMGKKCVCAFVLHVFVYVCECVWMLETVFSSTFCQWFLNYLCKHSSLLFSVLVLGIHQLRCIKVITIVQEIEAEHKWTVNQSILFDWMIMRHNYNEINILKINL